MKKIYAKILFFFTRNITHNTNITLVIYFIFFFYISIKNQIHESVFMADFEKNCFNFTQIKNESTFVSPKMVKLPSATGAMDPDEQNKIFSNLKTTIQVTEVVLAVVFISYGISAIIKFFTG